MKLIIGLGNPGEKYKNTRHNVGQIFIEKLKNLGTKELKNFRILKTDKFMNESGLFVKEAVTKNKIALNDLYIVHDDLDIPLGGVKIQFGKGPRVHNGLNDIYETLGTKDFWHVRIGIENRDMANKEKGMDYVLSDFTDEEKPILDNVLKNAFKKLLNSKFTGLQFHE